MNVNRRDSRVQPGGSRGAAQRAPRSGGRTTVQPRAHAGKRVAPIAPPAARRGIAAAAQFRTQGTAALRVARARPQRDAGSRTPGCGGAAAAGARCPARRSWR